MISAALHFLYIYFAGIASLGIYFSYRKSKSKKLKNFSLFFFSLAIYQLFLSLFIFFKDLSIVAIGYDVAIIIFFITISFAWKVPLSIFGLTTKKIKLLTVILFAVGFLVFAYQLYDLRFPIIDKSGFIFWNANPITATISSLAGFIVAMSWVYAFFKNLKYSKSLIEKAKTFFIFFGALTLGISSLIYYPSHSLILTISSFIAAFIGSFCIIMAVIMTSK